MISIDRFWAVRYPFWYIVKPEAISKMMAVSPWLITPMILIIEFLTHKDNKSEFNGHCSTIPIITFEKMTENSIITIVVCIAMIVLYSLIIRITVKQVCLISHNHDHN
jgi:hypothetical protein